MNNIKNRHLLNFNKYRYLLKELVVRDIKVKYKRSILGILWTLLNPLMTMAILTLVFSTLFKSNIPNFPVYFLCGYILFNFFSESTSLAMSAVYTNASLIRKVYIPKYIFPLSKVIFGSVNLGFSLIATLIVMIVTRIHFHIDMLLFFIPIIYLIVFSMGIGLIMSTVAVFFRDMQHLYSVLLTALNFLTPIFYPVDILPEFVKKIVEFNPIYGCIVMLRQLILLNQLPSLNQHLFLVITAIITLTIGLYVFYKKQDKFVLYT